MDGGAAERASGVGMEPHVDAVGVEPVIAFGKEPTRLVLLELRQADGALNRVWVGFW